MVALNVGQDFKKRWLNAPEAVRHAYQQDLARICDLLEPQTPIQLWVLNDEKAQLESQQKIEQAYADRKAELIEQARIRRQLALEKALADKRASEAAYAAELQADEIRKFNEQTEILHTLRNHLEQEVAEQTARYQKNPETPVVNYSAGVKLSITDDQILSELESLRLRLELEAESLIEQSVTAFRAKLNSAAQEEIEYILKNSKFSDEKIEK
ncbi:cell division protein BlhA [Acinetobacter sp. 161(2023)]|uniref:cell division protein BlhA n=1 Tax=Acinetobacter sp. 161(2023) TaxID=3098768 RepID=UPI0030090C35